MSYAQKLDQKSAYFVTGKFTILDTGSLELAIFSCRDLPKRIVYLLGRVKEIYTLPDDERIVNDRRR